MGFKWPITISVAGKVHMLAPSFFPRVFYIPVRTKRAFGEFKIRWVPPVPPVYLQPAGRVGKGSNVTQKNQGVE